MPMTNRHVEQRTLRTKNLLDRVDESGKLMLSVSSFVMQMIRPSPASPASSHTRRVFTLIPAWASIAMSAVSTARNAPTVWPMRSGSQAYQSR